MFSQYLYAFSWLYLEHKKDLLEVDKVNNAQNEELLKVSPQNATGKLIA